ncbi:tRNA A37 threonylcarbamoyladenosine dehydratase [Eubacterium ruminantium]|nr:tRNA A37 threonylcarbamoyladenosine dehydratase [Eubacterium ruminantium]
MSEIFQRTQYLIGQEMVEKLSQKKVILFGVGGVGGFVAEALARGGIGGIDLVDKDTVSESNINRQIIALHSTIGRYKTEVMAERLKDINPDIKVNIYSMFFLPETASQIDFTRYDYVIDAVDTVAAKIEIIVRAKEAGVPVISAMGAGNKLDPTKFVVTDIYKTEMCPLAKVMRHEMKKRNIKDLKVVYSTEKALKPITDEDMHIDDKKESSDIVDKMQNSGSDAGGNNRRQKIVGSISFVPSVAGLLIAGEVIKDIIKSDTI